MQSDLFKIWWKMLNPHTPLEHFIYALTWTSNVANKRLPFFIVIDTSTLHFPKNETSNLVFSFSQLASLYLSISNTLSHSTIRFTTHHNRPPPHSSLENQN